MTKKIALFYGHVASNIGDLAINGGVINLLRSLCPGGIIDVVLINANESEFLEASKTSFGDYGDIRFTNFKTHGEKAPSYLRSPKLFFEEIGVMDADIILLNAGEHIFSYQHEENKTNLFWRIFPAYAAKFLGKKCIQFPSTFGPFETQESSALFSSLLDLVDALAVRDAHSSQLLKTRYAVQKPALLDPAFFLDSETGEQVQQKHGVAALVIRSEGWGIRLSSSSRKEQTERFELSEFEASKAFEFSLEFASRLLNTTDETLRVFVQTIADLNLAKRLGTHFQKFIESGRLTIERPYSVQDYLRRLSEVDRVISNRFHALILGLVAGRQVYGFYFDVHGHKIPGLFNLLETPGRCQNLSHTKPAVAVTAVMDEISRESEAEQRSLQEHIKKLRQDTTAWLKEAFKKPVHTVDAQQLLKASEFLGGFADGQLKSSVEGAAQKQIHSAKKTAQVKEEQWSKQKRQLEDQLSEAATAHQTGLEELKAAKAGAQAKEDQWSKQKRQLEDQLSEAATAHQTGLEELKAAKAEAQVKEEQWLEQKRQLEGKLSKAAAQRTAMQENLVAAAAENQKLSAFNQAQLQAMQLELPNSWSNKIGKVFVEGTSLSSSLVRLPLRFYQVWREAKSRWPSKFLGGESFNAVLSSYANGGFDAVERLFASVSLSPTDTANAYTALARYLRHTDVNKACEAARRAYLADPRPYRRKWLAFRLDEAAQFLEADALLNALPLEIKFSTSEKYQAREIRHRADKLRLDKAREQLGGDSVSLPKLTSEADLFDKFREALRELDVVGAYAEFKRIKSMALSNSLSPDQQVEFENISKERVCWLELLELADTKPSDKVLDQMAYRICYVLHNSLPYSSGGYATRTHGVALGLQSNGWDVIALARPGYPLDQKPEMSADALETSVSIDGIQYLFTEEPLKRGPKSNRRGLDIARYIVAVAEVLVERFKDLKPAVVMAASNYHTALPALIAARRLGLPFIYEVRGFWEVTRMSRQPDYAQTIPYSMEREMETGVAMRADHVFTLTGPMKEELTQRGVNPEKITLLPNSCDIGEFLPRARDVALVEKLKIPEGVPVIGYIGTFVVYEGLDDLAQACGHMAKKGIEFRLLLVGNEDVSGAGFGPIGQTIQSIAAECGYADWLIMPGRVPKEEVADYYSLIDIAPFPRKPWPVCEMVSPMKPLEAMAMEKAVLTSDVRALSEMIKPNHTGLLFNKGDIASLTDQLMRLISDRELRQKLGTEGRKWVAAERTWKLTAGKTGDIIDRVIRQRCV
ncbi:MAG: polysaccharide pyruvyl transferase family protein [Azoarcus sp.]|jgi:glycosyltransferase involved in cell wall biosynthesis/polysaccharide pyruvyl transferase WcaK-like protein|nr:polysaccharide pyruvyl transferase family protein [Azoarcus sp.]